MARPLGKLVADIMSTNLITITKDSTLDTAVKAMVTNSVSRLPVVDSDGRVSGIVTDRDLRLAADSPFLDESLQLRVKHLRDHKVSEIMKPGVVTVDDTAPIVEAAKLIRVSRISGLPVVNNAGILVGICSRADLVDHLIRILEPIPREEN